MAYKDYYEYKDIMEATGKSFSSVKKWRITVERLSGHEFKKTRMRVSRRRVQDVYQFTEDEFDKFIRLSERINETKNMAQSVTEIWGDLKAHEERQFKESVELHGKRINRLLGSDKQKSIEISVLKDRVEKLEERIEVLEENQKQGLFFKIKNKDKR